MHYQHFNVFFIERKPHLHKSRIIFIDHTEFSKYAKFHKNQNIDLLQTHENMGPQTFQLSLQRNRIFTKFGMINPLVSLTSCLDE